MRRIGFSTGALALGDFQRGVALQRRPDINAIELSALRENELDTLIDALPSLDLHHFDYVSFHAPSQIDAGSEQRIVDRLKVVADRRIPIIVHPNVIWDFRSWRQLGGAVLLENMDQRNLVGRTVFEMRPFFDGLPDAGFCFDIAHARQIDPTMTVADELLHAYSDRLAELHISEVDEGCRHIAITRSTIRAYRSVAQQIPDTLPVIIESMIDCEGSDRELARSKASLKFVPSDCHTAAAS